MTAPAWRASPPWVLVAPAVGVGLAVCVPLATLFARAFEADSEELAGLLLRRRNLELLGNTLVLNVGVLAFTTLLALPLAWLTTRSDLAGRRAFTVLGVLPLAVPGYVLAYALLALGGPYGAGAEVFGVNVPRVGGFSGALLALGLYTFPYLFLSLRAALLRIDPALEESARSLGCGPGEVFRRVVLPQLRPAFLAGGLLVSLHVLGDFGVVSLMRYETFSYALYLQYAAAYDRIYAAWLALMLLSLTGALLYLEARFLRGVRLHRAGAGAARIPEPIALGLWRLPSYLFAGLVVFVGLVLPVFTILFWMTRARGGPVFGDLAISLAHSVSACVPAAALAVALALPFAMLAVRYPSRASRLLAGAAYLGYATPALAFALALVSFTLTAAPWAYQTLFLLVAAYALRFLAEAVAPIRSSLYQATPGLEEAARSLGRGPVGAFLATTFPMLRGGLVVALAFVFLSAMKELPLTFLLSPIGFDSLAVNVWSYAAEALFAEAAPYALTILVFAAVFTWLLLAEERRFA